MTVYYNNNSGRILNEVLLEYYLTGKYSVIKLCGYSVLKMPGIILQILMNVREIVGATAVRICQALLNVTVEMDTTTLLLPIFAMVRKLMSIITEG